MSAVLINDELYCVVLVVVMKFNCHLKVSDHLITACLACHYVIARGIGIDTCQAVRRVYHRAYSVTACDIASANSWAFSRMRRRAAG